MYNDKTEQMLNNRLSNSRSQRPHLNVPVTDGNEGHGGSCGCVSCCGSAWGIREYPLATVYSPCQEWRNLYAPTNALLRGTLFTELDLPFEGSSCNGGGKGCRG